MKSLALIALLAALLCCDVAMAEITAVGEYGFTTVHERNINAPRAATWHAAIQDIAEWWNADHTVSGEADRLSIDAVPTGCFCESLGEEAGVVHLTVTMVNPQVVLRLSGGLGPLGLMGVAGNMTWEFEDIAGGTKVRFTYAVGGFADGGLDAVAAPVDFVVGEALARLQAYVDSDSGEKKTVE